MKTQPEALRLADELDAYHTRSCHKEAAAELRRLHAENERLSATVKAREDEILTHSEAFYEATRLLSEEREKNERLLEALKLARSIIGHPDDAHSQMIDAAIKEAEETK